MVQVCQILRYRFLVMFGERLFGFAGCEIMPREIEVASYHRRSVINHSRRHEKIESENQIQLTTYHGILYLSRPRK